MQISPKDELLYLVKDEFHRCEPLFLALGDEVRQKIVFMLMDVDCYGLDVSTITKQTRLSRPAVSHHLKILKNAGILQVRREGTHNYYLLDHKSSNLSHLVTAAEYIKELMQYLPETTEVDGGKAVTAR